MKRLSDLHRAAQAQRQLVLEIQQDLREACEIYGPDSPEAECVRGAYDCESQRLSSIDVCIFDPERRE